MIQLKNLEEKDGMYYVGHIADIDGDGWVTLEEAESIIASINLSNAPDELLFWVDGDYEAQGGYFIRNDLKKFFEKLIATGKEPVGIKIDMKSLNLEVIVKS
jgi:hypothetical protein